MNINVPSENSESGTLLKVIGGVVFLLILIVIYMISRQYAKMQETIRRMEIQNEVAAKPQVVMETLSLEPVITSSNISTNGRCGPEFNNTICPGKQCCSTSSWCAGTQGTKKPLIIVYQFFIGPSVLKQSAPHAWAPWPGTIFPFLSTIIPAPGPS